MNFKFFFFAFCLFSSSLLAQSEQTLFSKARVTGGFGGPIFTFGEIEGVSAYGAGGGGGVVFKNFFLGGFGVGEGRDLFKNQQADRLDIGYGGLWLGYTVPTQKVAHVFSSVKLGGGGVGVYYQDDFGTDDWEEAVFVAVPEIGLELNMTHWWRLSATAGYRKVFGFDGSQNYGSSAFDGVVYGLTLRFGWFGHKDWSSTNLR